MGLLENEILKTISQRNIVSDSIVNQIVELETLSQDAPFDPNIKKSLKEIRVLLVNKYQNYLDSASKENYPENSFCCVRHVLRHSEGEFVVLFPAYVLPTPQSSLKDFRVLMFTTPLSREDKVCEYFLEDKCIYGSPELIEKNELCSKSHGRIVNISHLRDINYLYECNKQVKGASSTLELEIGEKVFSKYEDGIYHLSEIVETNNGIISVRPSGKDSIYNITTKDIYPFILDSNQEIKNTMGISDYTECNSNSDLNNDIIKQTYSQPTSLEYSTASWEAYSNGFASRMMAKMGHIPNTGLGARGQGMLTPIKIFKYTVGTGLGCSNKREEICEHKGSSKSKLEDGGSHLNKSGEGPETDTRKEDNIFDFINNKTNMKDRDPSYSASTSSNSKYPKGSAEIISKLIQNQINRQRLKSEISKVQASIKRNAGNNSLVLHFNKCMDNLLEELSRLGNEDKRLDIRMKMEKNRKSLMNF